MLQKKTPEVAVTIINRANVEELKVAVNTVNKADETVIDIATRHRDTDILTALLLRNIEPEKLQRLLDKVQKELPLERHTSHLKQSQVHQR